LAQVEGLATGQPVLMVCADVHWSAPPTRELLDPLIDRVPTLRVLVVITFRPEFAAGSAVRARPSSTSTGCQLGNALPLGHGMAP
jgi:predicted ATPase